MLKNMKKIVSVVWAIILVISFSNLTLMAKEDSLSFVELEEKEGVEILAELENAGLKLPEAYQQDRILAASSVKMILSDMKAGKLNDIIPYNYTELVELAKEVGHIANDYGKTFVARASALQDSTLYGTWSDSYLNYNCYGHAIGKHVFKNPGYYSGQKFSMSLSIQSMAKLVVDDLASLGYTSYYKTTKPSTLKSYEKVIAIRKGTADYHFMKGQTTTNWTHKPGNTNILKWNYTSPNQKIWTNECVFKGTYYSSDTTYNSTIYYIIYWPKDVGPQPDSISLEDIYEKK